MNVNENTKVTDELLAKYKYSSTVVKEARKMLNLCKLDIDLLLPFFIKFFISLPNSHKEYSIFRKILNLMHILVFGGENGFWTNFNCEKRFHSRVPHKNTPSACCVEASFFHLLVSLYY
jgi:hypothetical protein